MPELVDLFVLSTESFPAADDTLFFILEQTLDLCRGTYWCFILLWRRAAVLSYLSDSVFFSEILLLYQSTMLSGTSPFRARFESATLFFRNVP